MNIGNENPNLFGYKRIGDIIQGLALLAIAGLTAIVWDMRGEVVELKAGQLYQNKFYEQQAKLMETALRGLSESATSKATADAQREALRIAIEALDRRIERIERPAIEQRIIGRTPQEPR